MFTSFNKKIDLVFLQKNWTKSFVVLYLIAILEVSMTFFGSGIWQYNIIFSLCWLGVFILSGYIAKVVWKYKEHTLENFSVTTFWDYSNLPKVTILVHLNPNDSDLSLLRSTLIACKKQKYSNLEITVISKVPNIQISYLTKILKVNYFMSDLIKNDSEFEVNLQAGQIPDVNLILEALPHLIKDNTISSIGLCTFPLHSKTWSKPFANFLLEQNSFWNLTSNYKLPEHGFISRKGTNSKSCQIKFIAKSLLLTNTNFQPDSKNWQNWSQIDLLIYMILILQLSLNQTNLASSFFFLQYFLISSFWKKRFNIKLVFDSLLVNLYLFYSFLIKLIRLQKSYLPLVFVSCATLVWSVFLWQMLWSRNMFFSFASLVPSLVFCTVYFSHINLVSLMYFVWKNPNYENEIHLIKNKVNNWHRRRKS
jgi:hypothetical protein